ncbi:MAG: metallophosphoesterase, partial [Kiritimatiellae bacterium]|nr:metallophosphoesterase [Kiritimatiellia bacterium]
MISILVSDIHLGSPHSNAEEFIKFLNELPAEAGLIINGDVVDHWHRDLEGISLQALERLKAESYKRKVIWVRGNHDSKYKLEDPAKIEFADSYHIGKRLYIAHGHNFDNVMPPHKGFIIFFKM